MSGEVRCCDGACSRRLPILVRLSELTGKVYAVTHYTRVVNGIRANHKHDVTEDVSYLMQRAWNQGWDACVATPKGQEVRNPYAPTEATR